jgi:hypothetical protein
MQKQLLNAVLAASVFTVGTATLAVTGFSAPAEAGVLVRQGGANSSVVGINQLQIDSQLFDVSFERANYNSTFTAKGLTPTFLNNVLGANNAVTAINAFFNDIPELGEIFLGNENFYYIPTALSTTVSGVGGLSANANSAWVPLSFSNVSTEGGGNTQFIYATFKPSAAAIPTPALLPGLVGLGLGVLRKKKQAEVNQEI